MYCPKCFSDSLILNSKGVVTISINKKQMNSGKFIFNKNSDSDEEILRNVSVKINEFLKWYSKFNYVEPIHQLELVSNNFICSNGCKIDMRKNFSVVNVLVASTDIINILNDLAPKYAMSVNLLVENME